MAQPILVTGATGNTGRHVVEGLLAEGVPVRALTRDPQRAGLPDGVEVVGGDVTRPDDVAAAAKGTAAAYLVWPGTDEAAEGAAEVVAALGEHVDRIVYLSAADAEQGGVWGGVERAVRASVREWTFLRVTGLAVNALTWSDQVHRGVVRSPFGGATRSLVHELDVAEVAVRALVDDGHAGRAYLVTGPEQISQADQVRVIGEVIGVPARWEEQPLDEARTELAEAVGADFADQIIDHWSENLDVPEPVSEDVPRVLGRPGLTFREWVRDHAAAFTPGS
ncbi:SDR family oxidoreductase [Nocardiopsis ganjiahuensis]|uniref:SDR family oxidoreductase n=1 Tax=Nocardiopsis ganjiahuensis TaxID=239984 RepID=UPI000345443F|nr:NAD(P)H-binding protein [Nocardiopsis ganjiahuensis]